MSTSSCEIEESVECKELRPNAQELWRHYQKEASSQTENALVERYLPLVRYAVGRLAMTLPDHVDRDDLHSAGLVGLLQSLRNYDPASGTSFESYARLRIRGAMLDELRRLDLNRLTPLAAMQWLRLGSRPPVINASGRCLSTTPSNLSGSCRPLGCVKNFV